jgi:ATP-dependent exoDNAse (exonuclease V) beta subunit
VASPADAADIPADLPVETITVLSAAGHDATRRASGGPAFGLLVHEILAHVPLGADRPRVVATAMQQARVLGLPDEIAVVAAETVAGVLTHDAMARARRAEERAECRRETPVVCPLPDGTLVEGVVDLAFLDEGGWHVIDFKTDRELSEAGEERYRRQVAVYCAGIAQATGQRTRGTILRI